MLKKAMSVAAVAAAVVGATAVAAPQALAIGERPGPWALVGGVVVIGAVTARASVGRRRR